MRRALCCLTLLLTAGCASAAPDKWLLYARANYLQGRLEAKGEALCAQSGTLAQADFCAEAKATRDTLRAAKPGIEAELSQSKPDMQKILQYVDLVFSLASKGL